MTNVTIKPSFHKEASYQDADGNVYPLGTPFEYDGKIDQLRSVLPEQYEVSQATKAETQSAAQNPPHPGDVPEKGADKS